MTRFTRFTTLFTLLVAVYLALWFDIASIPLVSKDISDQLVPVLPFNALVTLGSYCLWELGMGILTFGDCEDAQAELMKEITQAKDVLRTKGVSVD